MSDRRLLARIHLCPSTALRSEIEPCAQDFMRYLFVRQHVAGKRRLEAARACWRLSRQLQGFEIAAAAWERDVLPARVLNYEPRWLDEHMPRGRGRVGAALSRIRMATAAARPAARDADTLRAGA